VVDVDLVWEGVRSLCGNGWDVVLVSVGEGDDLHGSGEERLLHGAAHLGSLCKDELARCTLPSESRRARRTALGARLGDGDLDGPTLPANLVVAAGEPGLAAALLEELDGELTPAAASVGGSGSGGRRGALLGVELAFEGGGTLVDHGLELIIIDVGQGEVKNDAGLGGDGGEEAVEEDGVEDAWAQRSS
jgi:hypothetical protein